MNSLRAMYGFSAMVEPAMLGDISRRTTRESNEYG